MQYFRSNLVIGTTQYCHDIALKVPTAQLSKLRESTTWLRGSQSIQSSKPWQVWPPVNNSWSSRQPRFRHDNVAMDTSFEWQCVSKCQTQCQVPNAILSWHRVTRVRKNIRTSVRTRSYATAMVLVNLSTMRNINLVLSLTCLAALGRYYFLISRGEDSSHFLYWIVTFLAR